MMNQNLSAQELEQGLKQVVRLSRIVTEEMSRTTGLVEKGWFGYDHSFNRDNLLNIMTVIKDNCSALESAVGDITDVEYAWRTVNDEGVTVCRDQISAKWGLALIGRLGGDK